MPLLACYLQGLAKYSDNVDGAQPPLNPLKVARTVNGPCRPIIVSGGTCQPQEPGKLKLLGRKPAALQP